MKTSIQDFPDLKKEIFNISADLQDSVVDEKSHMADLGIHLNYLSRKLEEASKKAFKLHYAAQKVVHENPISNEQ